MNVAHLFYDNIILLVGFRVYFFITGHKILKNSNTSNQTQIIILEILC